MAKKTTQQIQMEWLEIESLIKARCIGFHRICHKISDDNLIGWRKQFKIRDLNKRRKYKPMHQNTRKVNAHTSDNTTQTKYCQGITYIHKTISKQSNNLRLLRAEIPIKSNQCNRCSMESHTAQKRKGH